MVREQAEQPLLFRKLDCPVLGRTLYSVQDAKRALMRLDASIAAKSHWCYLRDLIDEAMRQRDPNIAGDVRRQLMRAMESEGWAEPPKRLFGRQLAP